MTNHKRIALIVTVIAGLSLAAGTALANPSYFARGVTTNSAASTTPAYLTPGTATSTTPTFDAYAQTNNGGATFKADSAGIVQQFCASSTATVLNTSVEYSQDGIDWYRNFVFDPSQTGTTSVNRNLVTPYSISQTFASSSLQGTPIAANNKCTYSAFTIPTPFRYTRVVSSMTGGNGSIWNQLVPLKEQP
jgi:hypothetical protein